MEEKGGVKWVIQTIFTGNQACNKRKRIMPAGKWMTQPPVAYDKENHNFFTLFRNDKLTLTVIAYLLFDVQRACYSEVFLFQRAA